MSGALGRTAEHARVGDELQACEKIIYQRALAEREFSAESIHNDDYTRRQGYPGALVSAYVLCGYMSEPLVRYFGPSWFRSGEISLRFIGKGVQQHDHVRCGGTVREVVHDGEGPDRRVVLDLWMEKDNGQRPVVGTASAVVPGSADQSVTPAGSGLPELALPESRE